MKKQRHMGEGLAKTQSRGQPAAWAEVSWLPMSLHHTLLLFCPWNPTSQLHMLLSPSPWSQILYQDLHWLSNMLLHIPVKSGVTSSMSTFLKPTKMEIAGFFFFKWKCTQPLFQNDFFPYLNMVCRCCGVLSNHSLEVQTPVLLLPTPGMLATDIQLGTSLELSVHCHVPFLGTAYTQGLVNVTYKGLGPVPQPGSPRLRAAMGLAEAFLASALQFNPPLPALHLHIHWHPC